MHHLSASAIFGIVFAVGIAYTVGLSMFLSVIWDLSTRLDSSDIIIGLITVIGVAYAILVAMIAVAEWQNVTNCQATIDKEAFCISNLARQSECESEEVRLHVLEQLRGYTKYVQEVEYPALRRGEYIISRNKILDSLYADFCNKSSLRGLVSDLIDSRHERIRISRVHLPRLLMALMLSMSFLLLTTFVFYGHSNTLIHLVMSIICALFIIMLIAIFLILNSPFKNTSLVSFHEFNIVTEQIKTDLRRYHL